MAEHVGPALLDGQQGGEDPYRGRLPSAVGPKQPEDLARGYLKVHPVDDQMVAEAVAEAPALDRLGHGARHRLGVSLSETRSRRAIAWARASRSEPESSDRH